MIGDRVGKVIRRAVVIRTIEMVEGRNGEQPAVAERVNPREVQIAVAFVLAVHLDHAIGYVCWIHRHLVEVSTQGTH